MNAVKHLAIGIILSTIAGFAAAGQSSYDQELSQFSGKLRALMIRAERVNPRDVESRFAIKEELFELSKGLHRLQEEAMTANLELHRKAGNNDRQLLLAAAASKTLDLAQSLVDSYLDTGDKTFLNCASSSAQLARSLLAAQQ